MPYATPEIQDAKVSDYPTDQGSEPFRIPEIPAAAIQNATDPKAATPSVKSAANYPVEKPDIKVGPPKEEPFSIPEIPDKVRAQVPPSALVQPGSGSPTPLSVQMHGDPVAQPTPVPPLITPPELPKDSSVSQVPPSAIINPGSGSPTPLSTQMGTADPAAQINSAPVEGTQAPGAFTSDPTLGEPIGTGDHPFLPKNVDIGNLPEDAPATLEDKADKISQNPVGLAPEVADKIQLDEANKYNPKIPPSGSPAPPEPFSIPEIPTSARNTASVPAFQIPEIPSDITNPLSPQSIAAKYDYDANKINDAQKNLQIGDASNGYGFKQAYNAAIYASQYRNNKYMNEDDVHKIMDIAKDGWSTGANIIGGLVNTAHGLWDLPGAAVRAAGAFKEAEFPTGSAMPADTSGFNALSFSAIGAAGTPLAEGSDIVNPLHIGSFSTNASTISKENISNYQQMEQRVGVSGLENAFHSTINPAEKALSWMIYHTGDVYRALGIPGSKTFGSVDPHLQTVMGVAGLPIESGQDMNTMDPPNVLSQMRSSRQIANQGLAYSSGHVGPVGESVLSALHGGGVKTPEQLEAAGQPVNKSQIEDITNVGTTIASIAEMELIGKWVDATGWHKLTAPATDAILGKTADAFQGVADATVPPAVKAAKATAAKDAEIQAGLEEGGRAAEKAQIAQQSGQSSEVSDPIKLLGKKLVNNRIDDVLAGAAGAAGFHAGFPYSMLAVPGVQAARWVANGAVGLLSKGAELGNRAINWAAENTADALRVQADNHYLGKSLFTAEDTTGPIKQIFGSAVRNSVQGSLDAIPTGAIMSGGDPAQFGSFVGLGGAMHAAGGILPKAADVIRNQIADQSFVTDNNWNANRLPAAPPKAYGTDPAMDAQTANAMGRTDPNFGPVRTNAERHTFNELQNQFEVIAQLHVLDAAPFATEVQRLSNLGYVNDPLMNARGVAIDPTPGVTKARILVRSDHFDDAIHHELAHAIVNRMTPQDKSDLFSVYRINNDPNTFAQNWYGKTYNSLPENDADASTKGLPLGLTKSDIQREMVTEATSGLIKGRSLRELTNDPTMLATGQKALWNVLDTLGFDPFTTRSNSIMGVKQSIMAANMLEPLVRKTLRDNQGVGIPPVDLSRPATSGIRQARPSPSMEPSETAAPVTPSRTVPLSGGGVLRENLDHPFTSTAGEWQPVPKNVDITQVKTPANPIDISAGNRSQIRVENERAATNAQGTQNAYSVRPETAQKPVLDPRSGGWKTAELQRAYLPPENVSLKQENGQWHYRTDDKPTEHESKGINGSTPVERPEHAVDKDVAKALRGLKYSPEDSKYFAARVTGTTLEERISDALKLARERKESTELGTPKPKDKPINQDAVNKIAREGLQAKGWSSDDIAEHMPIDKGTGLEAIKEADANRKAKEEGAETADQLSDRQKRISADMEAKSNAQVEDEPPKATPVPETPKTEIKPEAPAPPKVELPQAPKKETQKPEKVEPQPKGPARDSDVTLESGKIVRSEKSVDNPESGIYKVSKRRYEVQDGQGSVYRKLNWSEANEVHSNLQERTEAAKPKNEQSESPKETPTKQKSPEPKATENPKPELPSDPRKKQPLSFIPSAPQQQEAPEIKQEPKIADELPSAPAPKRVKTPPKEPESHVEKALPVETPEPTKPVRKPIVLETNAQNAEFIKHLTSQGLSHGEAQHAANGIESDEAKSAKPSLTGDRQSDEKLATVQPDFSDRVQRWRQEMISKGYNPVITEGGRTKEYQQSLYEKYKTGGQLAAPPGFSYHEWGRAVDWANREKDGSLNYGNHTAYAAGRDLAKKYELFGGVKGDEDHLQDARYKTYKDLPKDEYQKGVSNTLSDQGGETFTTTRLNTTGKPPADPGGKSVQRDLPVTSTPAPIRYLNPSGMWDGPSARKFGSFDHGIIKDGNHIARFDTPEQGAAAQFDLLNTGGQKGYLGMSVLDAVRKWTGNTGGESEVEAYAQAIAKAGGLKTSDPITTEFLKGNGGIELAKAMAKQESGKVFPITDDQWKKAQDIAYSGVTGPSNSSLTESSKDGGGAGESFTQLSPTTEKPSAPQAPQIPQAPNAKQEASEVPSKQESNATVPRQESRPPVDDAAIRQAEDNARAAIQQKSMSDVEYSRAINQHMLQKLGEQHAASLPDTDTRVRYNPDTGYTSGTHFVDNDPFHQWLLRDQQPQIMQVMKTMQDAIAQKRDIAVNYNSAPQPVIGMPTGTERTAAQTASEARARAQGLADIQTAGKSLMPTWVGVSSGKAPSAAEPHPPPFSAMYGGVSPDKALGNAHMITHGLGAASPYGAGPVGSEAELDMHGYLKNQNNGWKGDGSAKLHVPPEEAANVPQESPGFVPYKLNAKKSQFWNLAVTGNGAKLSAKGATTGPGARSTAALKMSELNSGYFEKSNKGAYTNPLAQYLDLAHGPQTAMTIDPETGHIVPKISKKTGKPVKKIDWTEAKLHSGFEMLRADLTDPDIHDAAKIHPGHEMITKAIQEEGPPHAFPVKAGFMPGDTVEAKGERERISAAAVRTGSGSMYTAPNHHDAVVSALDSGEPQDPRGWEHGYTSIPTENNPNGRFLPREGLKESSEPIQEKVSQETKPAFMPGETTGFVSPEYGSGKDFKDVGKDFTGDNHRQAKTYFNKVDRTIAKMSGKGASSESHDVFGDFPTGAEASVMTEHQHVPYDLAKAGEAAKAMHQRQLSSLVWEEHPHGSQMLHTIDADLSPDEARAQLTKHNIENRIILADTPSNEPTRIKLYNPGDGPDDITDNVAKFIDDPDSRVGGRHTFANGRGEFIGDPNWESRDAAADEYRRISKEVQSSRPDLDWKDYNDHWDEAERHHQQIKGETEPNVPNGTKAQFMPGQVLELPETGERETVKSAAMRLNGKVYEAGLHEVARRRAESELGRKVKKGEADEGYTTEPSDDYPSGRFVDRKQGWTLARDNNQLREGAREMQPYSKIQRTQTGGRVEGLASEDLIRPAKAAFMPGDLIERPDTGERERVGMAAVRYKGNTYTGTAHAMAYDNAENELGYPLRYPDDYHVEKLQGRPLPETGITPEDEGYMTRPTKIFLEGRYISRSEGWELGKKNNQLGTGARKLEESGLQGNAKGLRSQDLVRNAQFMPGDTIEKNGERERIKSPAVKFPTGEVYEGVHHPDAQDNGIKDGHFAADAVTPGYTTEPTDTHPDGRFVGMKEGWKIGKQSRQLHPDVDPNKGFLNSEDLADYPHPEDREPTKAAFMPRDKVTTGSHGQQVRETSDYEEGTDGDELVLYRPSAPLPPKDDKSKKQKMKTPSDYVKSGDFEKEYGVKMSSDENKKIHHKSILFGPAYKGVPNDAQR